MAKKSSKGSGRSIPTVTVNLTLPPEQSDVLLDTLQARFEQNMTRHPGLDWSKIRERLQANPKKLASLYAMERTGGEPDVVGDDAESGQVLFFDCAAQSPDGRRSICYDGAGEAERNKKGVFPGGNAVDIAAKMGIELLDEAQYRALQSHGEFDTKTSSWIRTPADIRKRGGALFADRRYGHIFVYHNGAQSFYAARGFRGALSV